MLEAGRVTLAGTAAEEAVLGERGDGAGGLEGTDLHRATVLAAYVEGSLGLGGGLSWLHVIHPDAAVAALRRDGRLRDRVESTLREAMEVARGVVRTHRAAVERLAAALRDRHRLSGEDAVALIRGRPRVRVAAVARALAVSAMIR